MACYRRTLQALALLIAAASAAATTGVQGERNKKRHPRAILSPCSLCLFPGPLCSLITSLFLSLSLSLSLSAAPPPLLYHCACMCFMLYSCASTQRHCVFPTRRRCSFTWHITHPLPPSLPARIFSADDKLHVRGDGVIVTAPRVDIEGDLFFTAPAEGQTKLQDMPATLTQARQDIDAVTAQASALQAFHDAHFAASADPNTLTIMPAAPDTDADGDEDKAGTLLMLQASDIVLQGQVKIADPDNSGAEPQTLNDLPARFTQVREGQCVKGGDRRERTRVGCALRHWLITIPPTNPPPPQNQIESTVSDVSGEVDTLRSEQQKWHDTYFATDESDGLKVMAGTEDGSLTLKGNEINLDGSTQVRGTDGSYRPIGDVPQAVSEVSKRWGQWQRARQRQRCFPLFFLKPLPVPPPPHPNSTPEHGQHQRAAGHGGRAKGGAARRQHALRQRPVRAHAPHRHLGPRVPQRHRVPQRTVRDCGAHSHLGPQVRQARHLRARHVRGGAPDAREQPRVPRLDDVRRGRVRAGCAHALRGPRVPRRGSLRRRRLRGAGGDADLGGHLH